MYAGSAAAPRAAQPTMPQGRTPRPAEALAGWVSGPQLPRTGCGPCATHRGGALRPSIHPSLPPSVHRFSAGR
eukprot:scaffold3411_cov396-Prasinococcus_capsulatus_cf.AAC.12